MNDKHIQNPITSFHFLVIIMVSEWRIFLRSIPATTDSLDLAELAALQSDRTRRHPIWPNWTTSDPVKPIASDPSLD